MKECGRCGDDYEGYMVFVRDNFSDIVRMKRIEREYGQVCEDCREELAENDEELYQ